MMYFFTAFDTLKTRGDKKGEQRGKVKVTSLLRVNACRKSERKHAKKRERASKKHEKETRKSEQKRERARQKRVECTTSNFVNSQMTHLTCMVSRRGGERTENGLRKTGEKYNICRVRDTKIRAI